MLKPRTYFICLTMVLFPDSPPPAETQALSVLSLSHTHTHTHLQHPYTIHSLQRPHDLPSSSNLTSLARLTPSSFRFFSIALLRSRAARSSALKVHPIARPRVGTRDSCIPNIRLCPTLSRLLSLPIVAKASVSELRSGTGSHSGLLIGRRSQLLLALRIAGVYWAAARAHLIL